MQHQVLHQQPTQLHYKQNLKLDERLKQLIKKMQSQIV